MLIWFAVVLPVISAQIPLGTYNVDTSSISVSGFSSGGAHAHQYHVIHSASLSGAGIYAGATYECAEVYGTNPCMYEASTLDIQAVWDVTNGNAARGEIDDPVTGMPGDRIYIFNGVLDTLVYPDVADMDELFYSNYMPLGDILKLNEMDAQHGVPHMVRGPQCHIMDFVGGIYVNDCDYDSAFDFLNHIYGGLTAPDYTDTNYPPVLGDYYEFDQTEFFDPQDSGNDAWDDVGYAYVPTNCISGANQCRLHIHFHGCGMGRYWINDQYVLENGIREVATLNDIIVLYPQVQPSPGNNDGCWDWWGYTGPDFATKQGHQITAVMSMTNRVTGQTVA